MSRQLEARATETAPILVGVLQANRVVFGLAAGLFVGIAHPELLIATRVLVTVLTLVSCELAAHVLANRLKKLEARVNEIWGDGSVRDRWWVSWTMELLYASVMGIAIQVLIAAMERWVRA